VDLVDDEAEQGLFLGEVEGVDHVEDPRGEVADAVAQLVVAGELVALCGEGVAAFGEVVAAVLDVGGAALQLGQLDELVLPGYRGPRAKDAAAVGGAPSDRLGPGCGARSCGRGTRRHRLHLAEVLWPLHGWVALPLGGAVLIAVALLV
jgi:hypothetical protein